MIFFCPNLMIPPSEPKPLRRQILQLRCETYRVPSRGPGLMPVTRQSPSEELTVIFRAVHVMTVHVRWGGKKIEIPSVVFHHAVKAVAFVLTS